MSDAISALSEKSVAATASVLRKSDLRLDDDVLGVDLNQLPVKKVPISSLSDGSSPRRSGPSYQHVQALAETAEPLPPILVQRANMSVIDGVHRLLAAKARGLKEIDVRFIDSDQRSCFVLAVLTNVSHGLPLSLADRRAAALQIIRFYPHWSDRMISSVSGLAARTVAGLRRQPNDQQLAGRVGRDGRMRPVNTAERRKIAADIIAERPDASLREIARQAGISPETVRSVRLRLRAGLDEGTRLENPAGPQKQFPGRQVPTPTTSLAAIRASTFQTLRGDPALRSSERGRLLLRMLGSVEVLKDHGDQIVDALPIHAVKRVAEVSRACARAWEAFAESAERRDCAL